MTHEEHEDGVARGGVDWPKRHDVEGVEDACGPSETEFGPVGVTDKDLVEPGFTIDADPE